MNIGDFYHTYCSKCQGRTCEGPKSEYLGGCEYRFELDEYAAAHERRRARTAQPSVEPDQTIGKAGTA